MTTTSSSGRELLAAIKSCAGMPGPPLLIPVGRPAIAFLRPVATRSNLLNSDDVGALTQWRNRFVGSFLTEFNATDSRTGQWLTEYVGPHPGKVIFMVDNVDGASFAYIGLDQIN